MVKNYWGEGGLWGLSMGSLPETGYAPSANNFTERINADTRQRARLVVTTLGKVLVTVILLSHILFFC